MHPEEMTMANQKYPESKSDGEFGVKHWTDSFPHSFHGWGPQTPNPDNELRGDSSNVKLRERDERSRHRAAAEHSLVRSA